MHYVSAYKMLKTSKIIALSATKNAFGRLQEVIIFERGFDREIFCVSLLGTGCLLELVTHGGSIV